MAANIEEKAHYVTSASTVSTAGQFVALSSVPQGIGRVQRIGDVLRKKRLNFAYTITAGAPGILATADQYNVVRVLIFVWKQDNGLATPTTANILNTSTTTSPYNWDVRHDYQVLYDKSHVVHNTPFWNGAAVQWDHGVGATYTLPSQYTLPLKGMVEFDADSTSGDNHVYLMLISDSAFTPNPSYTFNSQLMFEDA